MMNYKDYEELMPDEEDDRHLKYASYLFIGLCILGIVLLVAL